MFQNAITIINNISQNILQTVCTRFFDMNNSEIAWQYIIINIIGFAILLRLGFAFNYLRKHPAASKKNILKTIFSKDIFFSRSFRVDAGIFITNLIVFALLTVFVSNAITDPQLFFLGKLNSILAHYAAAHHAVPINPLCENALFTLILFLTYETLYYFAHRAFHYFPVLWQFHKVHHSTTHLSFMTDNRFHALEWFGFFVYLGFAAAFSQCICIYFFGGLPKIVAIHGIMIHYAIFYSLTLAQHSNLWLSFGRCDYLVVSPAMHILHHSTDPKNFNTNYALNLATLDWLFGTLKKSSKQPPEQLEIGLGASREENTFWANASLANYFFWPFQEVYKFFIKPSPSRETTM